MKISVRYMVIGSDGKAAYTRWQSGKYSKENEVFAMHFQEDLIIKEGDILIGEIYLPPEDKE